MWGNNNAGKYGITLDLSTAGARAIVMDLVRWADVVCESFSPGTMKVFGYDYESLKTIRPDIIMLSGSTLGTDRARVLTTSRTGRIGNAGAPDIAAGGFHSQAGWIAFCSVAFGLSVAAMGGVNAASRELGIDKYDAHRAVKVASLSPEAKKAARETGLDDNRKALLEAARAPAEQQAAIIVDFAARKSARPVAKVNAHEKAKAAWRVAAMCAEYIPREEWSWLLSMLLLAGADNIAEAFAAITDLPIGDYPLKEHVHALSEQSHAA